MKLAGEDYMEQSARHEHVYNAAALFYFFPPRGAAIPALSCDTDQIKWVTLGSKMAVLIIG